MSKMVISEVLYALGLGLIHASEQLVAEAPEVEEEQPEEEEELEFEEEPEEEEEPAPPPKKKTAAKKAPAKKAPAKKAAIEEEEVTLEDLRRRFFAFQKANGKEAVLAFAKHFGVKGLKDLTEDQYVEAAAYIDEYDG